MSKPKARCYRLFGNELIVCSDEIKIMYEKCDTSKILRIVEINSLTRSSPVELDADRKKRKFENCLFCIAQRVSTQ